VYDYNGTIGIEIRGERSFRFEKKQYGIETRNSTGSGIDVSLLGLPAESDWVLYAGFDEKTFIRDFLAYRLARSMGRYASRARYCELILNGRYQGIYIVLENIKRVKNRVAISKLDPLDTTGDNLTGGYIIRVDIDDVSDSSRGWFSTNPPYGAPTKQIRYQYYYPKAADIVSNQKAYIQNFISSFETVMNGPGDADSINGYPRYLDVGSAVDFFILNEMAKNVDAYRLSTYLYKDKNSNGGKLTVGPVWDFTNALGNADFYHGWLTAGWEMTYLTTDSSFLRNDESQVPFWWRVLFDDPGFMENIRTRWIELRQNPYSLETIDGIIDSTAAYLDEAQQRNFTAWPILGMKIGNDYSYFATYEEEVGFLKSWIHNRVAWMDMELVGHSLDIKNQHAEPPSAFRLHQNYPNPFNPSTTINFELPSKSYVTLKIFDILGNEIATVVSGETAAGSHSRIWDASGMPSGVYFCRLSVGPTVKTIKLLLCR
jgi:hypothetical protein